MRLLNLQQFGRRVDIHATYPTGMQGNDDDLRACFLQRRNGRDQFFSKPSAARTAIRFPASFFVEFISSSFGRYVE